MSDNDTLDIRYCDIDEVAAWAWKDNPKGHDLPLIEALIKEHGFRKPGVYDEALGALVAGHGRNEVLIDMRDRGEPAPRGVHVQGGAWLMPIIFGVDSANADAAAAFAIADNESTTAGGWLDADLAKVVKGLNERGTGLAAMGLSKARLAEIVANGPKDEPPEDAGPQVDRADELRQKWQTEPGQLWVIESIATPGRAHRVLCGDSTVAEDVARLMGGERAVLMATDPPYGVDFAGQKYNPRAKDRDGIEGDKRHGGELTNWLEACLRVWFEHIYEDAAFYIWTAPMQEGAAAAAAILASGLHIQSQIIWCKNQFALGQADYHWQHEPCWYAFWKGKKHRWFGNRDKATVWHIDKVANQKYLHPMHKPAELYERPMLNHTLPGELCVDGFLGCGTSIVAAERTGRLCYGMELSPAYVAVCLERLAALGLEPRKAEGE